MYAVANSSDRIIIEETGKTYENRPLLILKVSSEENIKNLFYSENFLILLPESRV